MQSRVRPRLDRLLCFFDRLLARASGGRWRLFAYYIVSQPVRPRGLLPARRGGSIDIRDVGPGDPLLGDFDRDPAVLTGRFAQGARCITALKSGAVAGYLWFTTGGYEEDEVRCRFEPRPAGRRAWDFDVYIRPEHRGTLVFPRLWEAASARLHAAGIEQTLSRISACKPESLQAHRRLGARVLARCAFLKIGTLQLMLSSVAPSCALSFRRASRPVLEIHS